MVSRFQHIYTFFLSEERGKHNNISHAVQTGVHPKRGNRKLSSALSNSDLQLVHAFRRKHASTSCLSCDSASLRLQFPAFQDAEAELGKSESDESSKVLQIEYENLQKYFLG